MTLLRGIGQSFEVTHMDPAVVAESIELLAPATDVMSPVRRTDPGLTALAG